MPKVPVLKPDQAYTFSNSFHLPFEPEDGWVEFGYTFWIPVLTPIPTRSIGYHQSV
ncbi:MAG TPA: hypothetical protein IGR15_02755 [Synechococcus sp. M44_DOE_062]|nr:hypothetical protein [Synechococcus sp. M44_DOE_062]